MTNKEIAEIAYQNGMIYGKRGDHYLGVRNQFSLSKAWEHFKKTVKFDKPLPDKCKSSFAKGFIEYLGALVEP